MQVVRRFGPPTGGQGQGDFHDHIVRSWPGEKLDILIELCGVTAVAAAKVEHNDPLAGSFGRAR